MTYLSKQARKRVRARRGSEVIELALLLLPLLWLTFGAIDFGYFFYLQHNLQAAAREGARTGIIQGNGNAEVEASVEKIMAASGFKDPSQYKTTVDNPTLGDGKLGISVTVTMPYASMGVPPANVGRTEVKGVAVMRLETN